MQLLSKTLIAHKKMIEIIQLIDQQSPFVQSLIAATVFAVSVWLMRVAIKMVGRTGSRFLRDYQRILLTKHWLHKYYVNSNDQYRFSLGFNVVVLQSLRWVVRGLLIFIFFLGVNSLLNSEWLWAICSWLVFNSFLEASQWLKDVSSESDISKVDEDIKKEFFDSLPEIHKEDAKHLDKSS